MKCPKCGIDKEEMIDLLAQVGRESLKRIERLEALKDKKIKDLVNIE
jgi:hypothetical protein